MLVSPPSLLAAVIASCKPTDTHTSHTHNTQTHTPTTGERNFIKAQVMQAQGEAKQSFVFTETLGACMHACTLSLSPSLSERGRDAKSHLLSPSAPLSQSEQEEKNRNSCPVAEVKGTN